MRKILNNVSKRTLSFILAFAVILCSLTVSLSAFAAEDETVSFVLDAATNGGTVDGEGTKTIEANAGEVYTPSVEVGTPTTDQKFIGWSTDKDAVVGELEFVPKNGATYYAIFGHVIYLDGAIGDSAANGADGSKEKPFKAFSSTGVPGVDLYSASKGTTAINCVVVVNGAVTFSSITSWAMGAVDRRLYITGKDPTTGVVNDTSVTFSTFATGVSNSTTGIFKLGLYIDYITVANAENGQLYIRGNVNNFRLGANVEGADKLYVTGADQPPTSVYIETAAKNISSIDVVNNKSLAISGDETIVINGGYINHADQGVMIDGKVGGSVNVIVNDYDGAKLSFNTNALESVGGAVNYIFNNNSLAKIKAKENSSLKLNWTYDATTETGAVDAEISATEGFYYIDSAAGGKVAPTAMAGKFAVEFEDGYNTVLVNGEVVELDNNNCFMVETAATTTEPADTDWINVTYDYVEPIPAGTISFTLDAGQNGGNIEGSANKVMQIIEGNAYTSNVTVTAPEGLQFIGWSTKKDDYVGTLTFTPVSGATYYAIYGEVIYVGGSVTDAEAAKGSKANPYSGFSHSAIGNTIPFTTTSKNCVAVLNGSATIASISNWTIQADKRVYITGLDPTTGVKNTTSIAINTFALGQSGKVVFGQGVYMDHFTVTSAKNETFALYLRSGAQKFVFGPNIVNNGVLLIGAIEGKIPSMYVELGTNHFGASNSYFGMVALNADQAMINRTQVEGDATLVINGGLFSRYEGGIWLGGTVGGNLSVVVNNYQTGDAACLRVNTSKLVSAGSISYIFNNGSRSKPLDRAFLLNASNGALDSTIATKTQGGFYYIDSAIGGKVMPTETAGKFKVTFDDGYNAVKINGEPVALDSNNCFTIASTTEAILKAHTNNANAAWTTVTYYYQAAGSADNVIEVPTNHKVDLSKIGIRFEGQANPANGADVIWAECKTANAEIANDTFIAYAEGDTVVNATYLGQTTAVTFRVTDEAEAQTGMTRFAADALTVQRVGDGVYTVTVNETEASALKYGTLKNGSTIISEVVGTTGNVFKFSTTAPEKINITAEFMAKADRDSGIFPMGASIRTADTAIRFITRFPAIKKGTEITLDAQFTQAGVLIIPEILWDGETYPEASALVVADGDADGITQVVIGDYSAQNLKISKLSLATELFSDAAAAVYDIPADMRNVKMVAIPYLLGADGSVTFVKEEDINPKSYGEIYGLDHPVSGATKYTGANIKEVFSVIGTDHELDNDDTTTAISYATGEEITFTVVTAGNYSFEYELYKDNNEAIEEYGEAYDENKETRVKTGTFKGSDGHKFTLTTRLDNPGTVRLQIKVKDAAGNYLTFNTSKYISVAAAAGAEDIGITDLSSQFIDGGQYYVSEDELAWFYEDIGLIYEDQVARIQEGLQSAEITNWLKGSKANGSKKTYNDGISDVFEITYVGASSTGYDQYSVVVATVEEIDGVDSPLTSTGANGVFDYEEHLVRPSTFLMTVPNSAADGSCSIVSNYNGYDAKGVTSFEYNDNAITLRTSPHGVLNLQSNAYYTAISAVNYDAGGIKGGVFSEPADASDPYTTYAFGVLVRDYIALQFAKAMPQFEEGGDIKTSGGSQGGWQALAVAAADTDVNKCFTQITWLTASTNADDALFDGWMPAYSTAYPFYMSQNALIAIGARTGFELEIEAGLADATCPLYGLLALYNLSQAESTTFTGYQFANHDFTKTYAEAYGDAFVVSMSK